MEGELKKAREIEVRERTNLLPGNGLGHFFMCDTVTGSAVGNGLGNGLGNRFDLCVS